MHYASMPNVLIRDLPDQVHRRLVARAADAGQSLQQYLTAHLVQLAKQATLDEVLERIAGRDGGRVGFAAAVEDLASERAG